MSSEYLCDTCPVPQVVRDKCDCSTVCGAVRASIDWKEEYKALKEKFNTLEAENKQLKLQLQEKNS